MKKKDVSVQDVHEFYLDEKKTDFSKSTNTYTVKPIHVHVVCGSESQYDHATVNQTLTGGKC